MSIEFKKGQHVTYQSGKDFETAVFVRKLNQHSFVAVDSSGSHVIVRNKDVISGKKEGEFQVGDKVNTVAAAHSSVGHPGTVVGIKEGVVVVNWGNFVSTYDVRQLVHYESEPMVNKETIQPHPHAKLMAEYERRRDLGEYNIWEFSVNRIDWVGTAFPTFNLGMHYRLKKQESVVPKKAYKHPNAEHMLEWARREAQGLFNQWEYRFSHIYDWERVKGVPDWNQSGILYRLQPEKQVCYANYDMVENKIVENKHKKDFADLKIHILSGKIVSVEILNKGKKHD